MTGKRLEGEGSMEQLPSGSWRFRLGDEHSETVGRGEHWDKSRAGRELATWTERRAARSGRGWARLDALAERHVVGGECRKKKGHPLSPAYVKDCLGLLKLLLERAPWLLVMRIDTAVNEDRIEWAKKSWTWGEYVFTRLRSEGQFSEDRLDRIMSILSGAMRVAVKDGILKSNPLDKSIDIDSRPRQRPVNAPLEGTFEPEHINELLRHVEASHLRFAFLLAIDTGMRRGEIVALRWADFEEHARGTLVHVERSRTDAGDDPLKGTKNNGTRVVDVSDGVTAAMRDLHTECERKYGEALSEYIFWNYEKRTLVRAQSLSKAFDRAWHRMEAYRKEAAAQCAEPYVQTPRPGGFHHLRHYNATQLVMAGDLSVSAISKRIGHSSAALTTDRYAHVDRRTERKIAERTGQFSTAALAGEIVRKRGGRKAKASA